MRKTGYIKKASIVMASLMFVLSACSKDAPPAASNTQNTNTTANVKNSWEIDKSPVELSIFVDTTGFDFSRNWGKDDVSKKWIADTGVNLKWEAATDADHKKLNLMIASGNLPDIMVIPKNFSGKLELASKNAIWPLNKLAEQAGAKNFLSNFDPHILLDKRVSYDSNDIFAIPAFHTPAEGLKAPFVSKNLQGVIVNENIYKELGSPAIKTGDDYIALLKQVKAKYPDLIPALSYRSPSPDGDGNPRLIEMLLKHAGLSAKFFKQGDGYIKYWQHANFLPVLKFANRLYTEGLIDKSEFTDDKTKLQSKQYNGTAFSTINEDVDNITKINDNIQKAKPGQKVTMIEPFVLVPGAKYEGDSLNGGFGEYDIVISKSSKNPERALRFLDYISQKQTQKEIIYGLEGKGHTMVNGMPVFTKEYLEDEAKVGRNNSLFGNFNYYILRDNYWSPLAKFDTSTEEVKKAMELANKYYADLSVYSGADTYPANSEAAKVSAMIKQFYRNEIMKIITGKPEEVEASYTKMIAEMKKLGLDTLNKHYTDYFKNKDELRKKYENK